MVRSSSNSAASCDDPAAPYKIDRIRLRIWSAEQPDRDLCSVEGGPSVCEFSCEDGSGATAFDIPEGTYFFDLVPVTVDGSEIPPSVVVLPAPLRRRIVEGDITDLGIWQIVIL